VPGVRYDYFREIAKGAVNPRLTARFKLASETTLKGGVGLFSQPPDYGETVAPVGNPNLGLSQAQHYGLGVEQTFGRAGMVSLEGFYKRLSDLEVNGVGPDGQPLLVNGGVGRIYGVELLAKLNPTGHAFGFLSYTLSRSERNDHGEWNGQNLVGIDPRGVLLGQQTQGERFSLLTFVRQQTQLCRVLVRGANLPWAKRYPALVASNPRAATEGVAGYEILLNFNGLPYQLTPRAASEISGKARFQLLSVSESEQQKNSCRRLVARKGSRWELTSHGVHLLELLSY